MLFKEVPTNQETKKLNRIKRPDRNRKEKETQAREELSQAREELSQGREGLIEDDGELSQGDILELMGVNERGHRRHRGAWRQA